MTTDPLVGTFVGRYRITRLLGKGGMGRVYLAGQPDIGSRVAIKLLAEEFADSPDAIERFFREARTVNLIRHENIINVLDLDRLANGRPFIVMELVDGQSLRDFLGADPLPLGGIVHVLSEVLLAIHAAHEAGVVHRDLKPDNVMITPAGNTKVLDFGIAKLSTIDPLTRTRTGTSLGTPHYMAPEQILGTDVDARCDVYAAGIMLFELATGRRPFQGTTDFHLMEGHLRGTAPLARSLRAEIPEAIEAVIAHAIAKRPEDRFQSAHAMAHALRQAAATLPASEWRPIVAAAPSVSLQALPAMPSPTTIAARPGRLDQATRPVDGPPEMPAPLPVISIDAPVAPHVGRLDATKPMDAPRTPVGPRRSRRKWIPLLLALGIAGPTAIVVIATRSPERPVAVAADAANDAVIDAAIDAGVDVAIDAPHDAAIDAPIDAPVDAARVRAVDAKLTTAEVFERSGREDPKSNWDGGFAKWADYSPKHFDASRYIARATELARTLVPDATLAEMQVKWVYPDGHVEMAVASEDPSFEFVSASKARPCMVLVLPAREVVTVGPTMTTGCSSKPVGAPKCTVAQVLARAKARGAPVDPVAGGGFGPRNFVTWNGAWTVVISDKSGAEVFREIFDDAC